MTSRSLVLEETPTFAEFFYEIVTQAVERECLYLAEPCLIAYAVNTEGSWGKLRFKDLDEVDWKRFILFVQCFYRQKLQEALGEKEKEMLLTAGHALLKKIGYLGFNKGLVGDIRHIDIPLSVDDPLVDEHRRLARNFPLRVH